jgi:hypothetical protein
MQQKQKRSRRITPAIVPITIPAMAPPLKPEEVEAETTGKLLPEAVTTGRKVPVEVIEGEFEMAPVGLNGAE